MNWTLPENLLVSFNIRINPRNGTTILMTTAHDSTRANLTLAYNVPYNVTIMADFCGQRNATSELQFKYGKLKTAL